MIQIDSEHLISLHDVPKLLPSRRSGKRLHISAVYRWAQRGIRGKRLEVVRIGGTTYTSREALQRFVAPQNSPADAQPLHTTFARRQQMDLAAQRVQELLQRGIYAKTTHNN